MTRPNPAIMALPALLAMTAALPATAQTAGDDARCLLVSNTYARTAPTQEARVIAGSTAAFYLGRIDGRVASAALKAALVEQQKRLTPANGPAIMRACTERVGQVERTVTGLLGAATPPRRPQGDR